MGKSDRKLAVRHRQSFWHDTDIGMGNKYWLLCGRSAFQCRIALVQAYFPFVCCYEEV